MNDLPSTKIFSVTEITKSIKGILETGFPFVTIAGEISNLRQPFSGHLYFTLKDEKSQMKGILFKQQQRYLERLPVDGQQVICRGRISVYEARGEYQLIVDFLQTKGSGQQYLLFEQLKRKLAAEGLFDQGHKRPLPFLPSRIGVVTSPDGAALFDFLKVALARFPGMAIDIFPVRVQGEEAAADIVEALHILNELKRSEIIVLCRGGGSLEDLWPFNREETARAVYASDIPVVSAIGHEIDFTIVDFVADHRSPTPSAAAEEIVPDAALLRNTIRRLLQRQAQEMAGILAGLRNRIALYRRILGDPQHRLDSNLLQLDYARSSLLHGLNRYLFSRRSQLNLLSSRLRENNSVKYLEQSRHLLTETVRRLHAAVPNQLATRRTNLAGTYSVLAAVNPHRVLQRGYAIVKDRSGGELITASSQVRTGQLLDIRLARGGLGCEVKDIDKGRE
jgi:exodeoxyribonuclease VII large subunit